MKGKPVIHLRRVGGTVESFAPERIHAAGAERHLMAWVRANELAVSAAASYIDPSDPTAREFLPLILLRVLDGEKHAVGLAWNKETKKWKPRK